ncbi:DUF2460 domain-containing protein [Sphingobium sp. DEHP117]|uniref:DUF2460 domain-containing protein n=1 Tax=Sphingobium sp. DEHP117 TaxID=2993436 RepID=UPI0027D6A03C|nr:TIGR02217 family protein [Sphingobium sp. DEHP117]MDQ4420538.1 DUF2460 domain-containing protein [Sphingobium sp. DEHP117]
MAYWLASADGGQERGFVKRFSPAFWTVNFPRPMMASVVTTAPDALRVDTVFYGSGDLAGLIWEAQDQWDHPLLAYETRRDFRNCQLRFHWRSSGIRQLDAVNGPTLTIEGRDAGGAPRSWYVRLWNYASGSPTDADITIDFNALNGGFLLPAEADPVWAGDIDRIFISLVPTGYDGGTTQYPLGQEGWVELTGIACDGSGSVLSIGDPMLPEHGLSIATGYDDAYNQTPERVLWQIRALGYRGDILHYVGMSHYFRLELNSGAYYASLNGGVLCSPCAAWHADFAARAQTQGFGIIWSLSYELLDQHCWGNWKQRAEDGSPALTGWSPPSTLLSPAQSGAMGYLHQVGAAFIGIGQAAGLAPKFQVGEPWWWVMPDGRICLYDAAAKAAFGGNPVSIPNIRASLNGAQTALLDQAGALLASSTAALVAAVKAAAPACQTHLLTYLPTVLDSQAPEAKRANMPLGWAKPAFDVLQLEDYDWVTGGHGALSAAGAAAATTRLGYAAAEQHYLSGFVLQGADAATQWPLIEKAARVGEARGVARTFIWALPQVARDGFTYFCLAGEPMQAFDDVIFPLSIGKEASVTPAFSTQTVESISGHERRSSDWADARLRFDAGPGVRSEADLVTLIDFFRARRGAARGFRFTDPFDNQSAPWGQAVSPVDQKLGTGDGATSQFALAKYYGSGAEAQQRRITRPVAGTIRIAANGVELTTGWQHLGGGMISFNVAPASGVILTAGFRFDVPVRFAEDALEVNRATFAAGEAPSVPLVEIRE